MFTTFASMSGHQFMCDICFETHSDPHHYCEEMRYDDRFADPQQVESPMVAVYVFGESYGSIYQEDPTLEALASYDGFAAHLHFTGMDVPMCAYCGEHHDPATCEVYEQDCYELMLDQRAAYDREMARYETGADLDQEKHLVPYTTPGFWVELDGSLTPVSDWSEVPF